MERETGSYRSVAVEAEREIVIQKSRFIGRAFPADTQERAEERLAAVRKQHWDATHNCYAYVIGRRGEVARFSDDGEPGGTAGRPMMEVLKAQQLVDVLLVVTRYFGGVLLGAGGLVRAYSRAAAEAIDAAGIMVMEASDHFWLDMDYGQWDRLRQPVEKAGYRVEEVDYAARVRVRICVKQKQSAAFLDGIQRRSDGRVVPQWAETSFAHWPEEGKSEI